MTRSARTCTISEESTFSIAMACLEKSLNFNFNYLLHDKSRQRITLNFRSVFSCSDRAVHEMVVADTVVRRGTNEFQLISDVDGSRFLTIGVDLTKNCPYTEASFFWESDTYFSLSRLAMNRPLDNELFAFPPRSRLPRDLPVKVIGPDESTPASSVLINAAIARATVVRSVADRAGSPAPIDIPGLADVNWYHVRENDRKFAKALKELVPARLQSP